MKQLKKVNCLNDVVAVLKDIEVPDKLKVDQQLMEGLSNEGVIVGVGPEASGCGYEVGDIVIFRNTKYMTLQPDAGSYKGRTIILARKIDLLVKVGKSTKYEVVDKVEDDSKE